MLSRFEKRSKRAIEANRGTLVEILANNSDTEFGRELGFSELAADHSGEAFRRAVPLATYDDYRARIERMAAGERNILTSEDLLFFAVSSGTTGSPKLVPTTRRHHGFTFKYMGTVVQGVISRDLHRSGRTDRGVNLMTFSGEPQESPGGIPIGGATAEAVRRMARIVPHLWNSPLEVYTLDDQTTARYLHALYGLRNRDNQFAEAVFAPHLLEWIRLMESRWESLLSDIGEGTLTDDLDIDEALRQRVLRDNPGDPDRAAELRRATSDGFAGFLPRVWPEMTHLMTITTGSFAVHVPALRHYAGNLPIYSPSYGSTESFIGVGLWPDTPERYVMVTDSAYFEFLPIASIDNDQPETVDMAGVEVGGTYELVITNRAGLYRYRLGDIVTVVDRHGEAPVVEFRYRHGTQFDLVGEKTSEYHVAEAIEALCSEWLEGDLVEYSTAAAGTSSPPRYVVYLEVVSDHGDPEAGASVLDRELRRVNPTIDGFRSSGLLGAPQLVLVAPGTFDQLRTQMMSGELSPSVSQLKVPRRIDDEKRLAMLSESAIATSP